MTTAYVWTALMPGVYAPLFLDTAPVADPDTRPGPACPARTRPAWFPKRIVRRRIRRYRLIDARLLPY